MPDEAIVTVRFGQKEQDYALPLQPSIGEWLPFLAEDLGAGRKASLSCRGEKLDDTHSLTSYGIWDGSILTLTANRRETR